MITDLWRIDPMTQAMGAEAEYDYANEGSKFFERLTRCYELAGLAFFQPVDQPLDYEATGVPRPVGLIHGSWHGPKAPERIDHAWVRLADGRVWEPITALIYNSEAFYSYTRAVDDAIYGAAYAVRQMLRHQHYGPWPWVVE